MLPGNSNDGQRWQRGANEGVLQILFLHQHYLLARRPDKFQSQNNVNMEIMAHSQILRYLCIYHAWEELA